MVEGNEKGKRKRGRQEKWFDSIRERTDYNYVQAKRAAQDRTAWKRYKSADVVANRQTEGIS